MESLFADAPGGRTAKVLLEGWEQFDQQVDRIVSIGAFEHFGHDRYSDFFEMAYKALPSDGVMLLHTIVAFRPAEAQRLGIPVTFELARFVKFIMTEIFPGGRLPSFEMVREHAAAGGFTCTREQPLQPHYARTLDLWAAALEAHREDAIRIQSEEVYERYMEVPDRMREDVPAGPDRRVPVHAGEVARFVSGVSGTDGRCRFGLDGFTGMVRCTAGRSAVPSMERQ